MDRFLNGFVYFIAGGDAFFVGVALLFLGLLFSLPIRVPRRGLLRHLYAILGIILVSVSAIPLPIWLYGLGVATFVIWLISEELPRLSRFRAFLRLLGLHILVIALGLEIPWHFNPHIPHMKPWRRIFCVIGDSISAGMGENRDSTWPALLAKEQNLAVHDVSQMGATVASALKQASEIDGIDGLIILEIGGNDLLGRTSLEDYEAGLESLLNKVCVPNRTVVMLELPLPPFRNAFGRVQREASLRHQIPLIPRRHLLRILTTEGATQDGIHLTRSGHRMMAEMIWQLIQP